MHFHNHPEVNNFNLKIINVKFYLIRFAIIIWVIFEHVKRFVRAERDHILIFTPENLRRKKPNLKRTGNGKNLSDCHGLKLLASRFAQAFRLTKTIGLSLCSRKYVDSNSLAFRFARDDRLTLTLSCLLRSSLKVDQNS